MQIQNDISHILLFVKGELEGYLIRFESKPLREPARWFQDIWIIDESGRPYEHIGQLLKNPLVLVLLHFEEGGSN
jgi:hypothetical protein